MNLIELMPRLADLYRRYGDCDVVVEIDGEIADVQAVSYDLYVDDKPVVVIIPS